MNINHKIVTLSILNLIDIHTFERSLHLFRILLVPET